MLRKVIGAEALMQRTHDFHAGVDLSGRLEFAKAIVTSRYYLREILVKTESLDFLQERVESGGRDRCSHALDKGRVLFEGRVKGLAHGEDIYIAKPRVSRAGSRLTGSSRCDDSVGGHTLVTVPSSIIEGP